MGAIGYVVRREPTSGRGGYLGRSSTASCSINAAAVYCTPWMASSRSSSVSCQQKRDRLLMETLSRYRELSELMIVQSSSLYRSDLNLLAFL